MQLLVIAVLVLIFFGASRLGDVGRGLGQGVRAFRKGMQPEPDEEPRAPKVRQLESDPDDDEDEADEGVPMRRRISSKKPSAKMLTEKPDPEDEDERS